jgi:hypothetical protein
MTKTLAFLGAATLALGATGCGGKCGTYCEYIST